jgi:excisionase family DNA binding protein
MNAKETMRLLRISRDTLRAMLASGDLRGFERGKVIRIDRRSVEELLRGRARLTGSTSVQQ